MTDGNRFSRVADDAPAPAPEDAVPPSVGDLLRYLHARRVRLLVSFALIAGLGFAGLFGWWLFGPRSANGTLALSFHGIEKHEYPSGKKFTVEDIRSPRVLAKAVGDLSGAIDPNSVSEMYRDIDLVPIVPDTVLEHWKKQDRDGVKREEYLPNEFSLSIHPKGLDDAQRVRLLYAIVHAYQEQIRFEQEAAGRRATPFSAASLDTLIETYDYWDLPILLRAHADAIDAHLDVLILESRGFRDPAQNLSFRDVRRDLETWKLTQLEALAAQVHRERLVKDRESMLHRLEERQANIEVELGKTRGEATETTKLLEVVEGPKPMLAGQLSSKEGAPLVDVTALEKIVQSDYVGPVVRHVSDLHARAAEAEANKERLQREIDLLRDPHLQPTTAPPASFRKLVEDAVRGLDHIVDEYAQVLDAYLDATVLADVTLHEGPYLKLKGPDGRLIALGILFGAAVLSFAYVLISDSLRNNRRG